MNDYKTLAQVANVGRTPQLCQDAMIEMLEEMFRGQLYNGQEGRKPSYAVMEIDDSGEAHFRIEYLIP